MTKSWEQGLVPADWRTHRPVSLTSVCCKVMESLLKEGIVRHLERNQVINKSQHSFMRGKSCATNLVEFLNKLTVKVDGGEPFDIAYLDFAKAFDKVPKRRLLKKVWAHGIQGQLYTLIEAWFSDGSQRVVLNGEESTWREVLGAAGQCSGTASFHKIY